MSDDLTILFNFLQVATPDAWLTAAMKNLPLLVLDHAHCERKAAATAINLISKYPGQKALVGIMSPLAREELLHFEKVVDLMTQRGWTFGPLAPSSYAQKLHSLVVKDHTLARLRDLLLIGAIIEARSCERFYRVVPALMPLDAALARFYSSLVKAEARHFQGYLELAHLYDKPHAIKERLDYFLSHENDLIAGVDTVFRFHSGVPNVEALL